MPRIRMRRKKKKSRKLLGSRYHGYGQVGEHKGSGQRGGFGKAGGKDHIKLKLIKSGHVFGSRGFTHKGTKKIVIPVNVGVLAEMIKGGEIKVEKENDKYVISLDELPFNKVLGKGKVDIPIKIIVGSGEVTPKAREKIESTGGIIIEE